MKTDRFSDSIRRKLESIRPDFTEKDWTRMQAALRQATPPHPGPSVTGGGNLWTSQPWLLAAATVSTVVLVAVSVWQWREINTLRQTVEQLNQQPKSAQTTPAPSKPDGVVITQGDPQTQQEPGSTPASPSTTNVGQPVLRQRDTVYLTRRVPVPQQPQVETSTERSVQRTELPPEPRYASAPEKPVSANESRLNENKTITTNPITNGDSSTSLIEKNAASLPTETVRESVREQTKNRQLLSSQKRGTAPNRSRLASNSGIANGQTDQQRPTSDYDPLTGAYAVNPAKSATPENALPEPVSGQNAPVDDASRATITVEQLASLPMSVKTSNWQNQLTRRARKIRVAQPTTTAAQPTETAPASQPVHVATRFRVGGVGELSGSVWSAGLYSEVLVGKHFTLGIGLNKATHNSTFINDFDFESRTNRDFRREFTKRLDPKIDPKREILNIETRVIRVQLPVNIGYRVPLSQSVTFTPSIGTTFNLSSMEYVTFCLPIYGPQRGLEKGTFTLSPPVSLITTFQVAPGIEWQRGHWVVQGSPVFNVPVQPQLNTVQAIPGWPETALSLRGRLLYQF